MLSWNLRRRADVVVTLAFSTALAFGCGDDPTPDDAEWSVLVNNGDEALLSVSGSSSSDVWAVGADKGRGPAVLHWDGTTWERLQTGTRGDLWWVHVFESGEVFAGGERATVLRYDGSNWERMTTPGLAQHNVFGVWGRSPDEAWAVGAISGRGGFIWEYNGIEWTELTLPAEVPLDDDGDAPGIFKVWGDEDTTFFVGSRGLLLRDAGNGLEVVQSGLNSTVFTVHGNDEVAVAVGGAVSGMIFEVDADGRVRDAAPDGAPLLQGVCLGEGGDGWATGAGGVVLRRTSRGWREQVTGFDFEAESLHAVWMDPDGGVWSVGGNVLTSALDGGVLVYRGGALPAVDDALVVFPEPEVPTPTCPADAIDIAPGQSVAHQWNEQALNAIRRDIPRPGVHARNLFHLSVAMYDAWAAFDDVADGVVYRQRHDASDVEAARNEAIAYAAARLLHHRYDPVLSVGGPTSEVCFDAFMRHLGYDPSIQSTEGDSPAAIGNRIGQAVIDRYRDDGANESNAYADTTGWAPTNGPMFVDAPGAGNLVNPDIWQQLNLAEAVTQNGIPVASGAQDYIGANWGLVAPFALARTDGRDTYAEVPDDALPLMSNPEMPRWVLGAIARSAELDPNDAVVVDIGPGSLGNNPLGSDEGSGFAENPYTGEPYAPNIVLRADFGRVLAEYWADGPRSETPPGHWNTIANDASKHPEFSRLWAGEGDDLDALEWDVKMYLALTGATHDAAIAAWELKRYYLGARPITLIRHMGGLGQSTDENLPSYHVDGLPLADGLVELITSESSAAGQRHAHLANYVGQVASRSWRGEPGDVRTELGGVAWIRAVEWMPYQLRTFVTPAFPGFVSGHSTFSRAAAAVLAEITGSPYFPGGLGSKTFETGYLRFEIGPTEAIDLQWATYFDAADQAGQSRIWGGIHIEPDDFFGRRVGADVGIAAVELAETYFDGTAVP